MTHKKLIILITLVCCLFASSALAEDFKAKYDTAEDNKQVRLLVLREIEGFVKNDAEQVYSCYSPEDFVMYSAAQVYFLPENDNSDWTVWITGPAALRKYADGATTGTQFKNPDLNHMARVKCVHVIGNRAVAVAHREFLRTDTEKTEWHRLWFESAFFAKKISGKWKLTGAVSGIASGVRVIKRPPPAPE